MAVSGDIPPTSDCDGNSVYTHHHKKAEYWHLLMKIIPADATIAEVEKTAAEYEQKAKIQRLSSLQHPLLRLATECAADLRCRQTAQRSTASKDEGE
jgi:hypothetical protein